MNKKVTITPRWYGPVPTRNGNELPSNQWARAGRKRKWAVRWYSPDGSRPRKTFDRLDQAEDFVRTKTAEFETMGAQARMQPKKITLGEYVDEVINLRTGPTGKRLSINSLREYKTILTLFGSFMGNDVLLDQITFADAAQYVKTLHMVKPEKKRCYSPATINKHKRTLKCAFNVAITQLGYLQINPFSRQKQDKLPDQEVRYISPDEFNAITEQCQNMDNDLWWECFLSICYTAGTRTSEAAHLLWSDIDFENETIRIIAKPDIDGIPSWQPKDYDSRTIPVPSNTINLLTKLHDQASEGSKFVFLSDERMLWIQQRIQDGKWSEDKKLFNNLLRGFKVRAERAGVHNITLHDLRRSCITHWAQKLQAPIVKELAGHSDISTTLRYYVSIRDSDMHEAREVMTKALLIDPK